MKRDDDNEGSTWLEHWLTVGRVSKDAEKELGQVNANVVKLSSGGQARLNISAICLLYSNPSDEETGFTISHEGETFRLEVYNPDHFFQFVIYSVGNDWNIIQTSIKDTCFVTLGEWYEVEEKREKEGKEE